MSNVQFTPELRELFLEKLRDTLNVSASARAAGITPGTAYAWKHKDPSFADAWREAEQEGVDTLEAEARRRAFNGTYKPVFHKGEQCGEILEYSDSLAVFLLKGYRRSVFGDASKLEVTGKDGGPIELNEVERAKRLNELLALAEARKAVADLV